VGDSAKLEWLAAGLALLGISRRDAAKRMHLSCSALNKKLRGHSPLRPDELRALQALLTDADGNGERTA
jgi:transcriptional regulator with XRE-family HTH domain